MVSGTNVTGTRGRSLSLLPAQHPYAAKVLLSGVTTTNDFYTYPKTGIDRVVFPTWLPAGNTRQGWIQIHDTD